MISDTIVNNNRSSSQFSFSYGSKQQQPNHEQYNISRCYSSSARLSNSSSGGKPPRRTRNNYTSFKDTVNRQKSQDPKVALILGSSGAVGSTISRYLSQTLQMTVIGADIIELPNEMTNDWELDYFIPLQQQENDLTSLTTDLVNGVHTIVESLSSDTDDDDSSSSSDDEDNDEYRMKKGKGLDVIICASGGWMGDPSPTTMNTNDPAMTKQERILQQAQRYSMTATTMIQQNLYPVLAAGYIAQYYMNPQSSLMVVMGAAAALQPTPGMLGYGVSKVGAHHCVTTLGACTGKGIVAKSLRKQGRSVRTVLPSLDHLTVVGIVPSTIDTVANRKSMPSGSDYDTWTKPIDIAQEIGTWIMEPELRPHSGSLVKITTTKRQPQQKDGGGSVSKFELVR